MPLNLALLKSGSLVGVFWGAWVMREPMENQKNFRELIAMIDDGKFVPVVSETYALTDYLEAFRCISERRAKGKVVLTNH